MRTLLLIGALLAFSFAQAEQSNIQADYSACLQACSTTGSTGPCDNLKNTEDYIIENLSKMTKAESESILENQHRAYESVTLLCQATLNR